VLCARVHLRARRPSDILFPNEQNIPWGYGGCDRNCFANEPPGSSICYPLRETARVFVDFPWTVVKDDPQDEIFYSSCFRADSKTEFDGVQCGDLCRPPQTTPDWKFADKCITCQKAWESMNATIPDWSLASKCEMCDGLRPDVTPYDPPLPPPPPQAPAPPASPPTPPFTPPIPQRPPPLPPPPPSPPLLGGRVAKVELG
jgi:hypothetical protein